MTAARGSIGNPWIFNEIKHYFKTGNLLNPPTIAERLDAIYHHAVWSVEWKGERGGIVEMRQHYSNYLREIRNIKNYRADFLKALTLSEIEETIYKIKHDEEFQAIE